MFWEKKKEGREKKKEDNIILCFYCKRHIDTWNAKLFKMLKKNWWQARKKHFQSTFKGAAQLFSSEYKEKFAIELNEWNLFIFGPSIVRDSNNSNEESTTGACITIKKNLSILATDSLLKGLANCFFQNRWDLCVAIFYQRICSSIAICK